MAWLYLFIAGIFEIFWAVGIKYCDGLKITLPLVLVIISMGISIIFLGLATKTIPMSIAYAVWTGIGIVGVFAYGLLILKLYWYTELFWLKVLSLLFIKLDRFGLKFSPFS